MEYADADFDVSCMSFEDFDEPSEHILLPSASNKWQLSQDLIPKNPNTVATTVAEKLRESSLSHITEVFKFAAHNLKDLIDTVSEPVLSLSSCNDGQISWGDLGLSRSVLKAISDILNFPNPTPIQIDVIPTAIAGKDILAAAATGSGKTAAFLLPIIERLLMSPNVASRRKDRHNGKITGGRASTRALVLLPTRELAVQCWSMFKALSTYIPLTSSLIVGGFDLRNQNHEIGKSPDAIFATPGRILDLLLNSQGVHFDEVDMVVLDEGDRLLELGFNEAIHEIMKFIPKKRMNVKRKNDGGSKGPCQTYIFSATLSPSIKTLAGAVLNDVVTVKITETARTVTSLTQEFMKIPREDLREAALFSLFETLIQHSSIEKCMKGRVVVFFREKKEAHRLAVTAQAFGLGITELNGNMNQAERLKAMAEFQAGEKRFLFATDIASRGLDMSNVNCVVNFNLPNPADAETRYIHRVGRTARMGRSGLAITLFTPDEYPIVKRIVKRTVDRMERQNVFERKIDMNNINEWITRIKSCKVLVSEVEKQERVEQEIYASAQQLTKQENMTKYSNKIRLRPKKTWIRK
jgi:ATP-dependent RNA helicase DDX27